MSNNIGVLASGIGSNFNAIVNNIKNGSLVATVKLLISDNKEAKVLEIANRENIKSSLILRKDYDSKESFEKKMVDELKKEGVDLVVLAGFMRVLSPFFVNQFSRRIINIHPSLLPSFTGLDVQKKALDYGVKYSGCTVHFVDEGVDTGPIILQSVVPVMDDDTVETLSERILKEEHIIYSKAIQLFFDNKLKIEERKVKTMKV